MKNGINLDLYFSIHVIQTMQMDRQWMYKADRRTKKFIDGLHYFLNIAEANKQNGFMCCPCLHCQNIKDYFSRTTLHSHIFVMVSCPNTYVGPNMEKRVL